VPDLVLNPSCQWTRTTQGLIVHSCEHASTHTHTCLVQAPRIQLEETPPTTGVQTLTDTHTYMHTKMCTQTQEHTRTHIHTYT
jgi:hypothetical protein